MNDETCCASVASFVSAMPGFEVIPHLVHIIAKGQPVSIQEVADLASQPVGDVEQMLCTQPGTDWDDDGRLVGFGLTLRPTGHRFVVAGRTLYAFCATDTLLFTHILGEHAVVESVCPVTSLPVRIELTPSAVVSIDPASAVVSQPRLDSTLLGDVRHNVCDHGHFFASGDAASGWAARHPGGTVLSVAEAFEHSRRDIEQLGWIHQPAGVK